MPISATRSDPVPTNELSALVRHRLAPVADLLAERGLVSRQTAGAAQWVDELLARDEGQRHRKEKAIVSALAESGVAALVLKGALLAHTVYPSPQSRIRGDLDLLIPKDRVSEGASALRSIGMRPSWEAKGGPAVQQDQWIFPDDDSGFALDLHWKLFNHPAVRSLFEFGELSEHAQPLPGLGEHARGLAYHHALLQAVIHYYAHHRGHFRPLQWVLDMDLLWRAMNDRERQTTVDLSVEKGVASLTAAGLELAVQHFHTPVDSEVLDGLRNAGRRERSRKLLKISESRLLRAMDRILWEPGLMARMGAFRGMFFPPALYMRRRFPEGSRFGLAGLYAKRLLRYLRRADKQREPGGS